jgi:trk system potassium uptake protein TrkA
MNKVELYKERISHTICLDASEEYAISSLPLKDTDVVIVAIGEDQGANIMATALFKNLQVKKLISRAINDIHEKDLKAIGVDDIVHPEEETADRWSKKLTLNNVVDSFELSSDFSIIEAKVPDKYVGKTLAEIGFRNEFNLLVLTTIKEVDIKNLFGKKRSKEEVQGVARADLKLQVSDILVLYGANKDL